MTSSLLQVLGVSPGSKLCTTFFKIANHYKTVAVWLRLLFQFTFVQYCCKQNGSFCPKIIEDCAIYRLLFILNKFVKGFLAITFYYILFLAETFMKCVNVFFILYNLKRNFGWIGQKMRNFPIKPHYENHPLL